jgi:hypothetical protein
MLDIQSLIAQIKRPRLLVRAARFGLDEYRRDRDLLRTLGLLSVPRPGDALMQLMGLEEDLNRQRLAKDPLYSIAQHIDALTGIMSEARLLEQSARPRDAIT